MATRAYGVEDKKARRDDIVEAARRLFTGGPGDLPSAARIAAAAGLAKGTLYLYFRTKEAIFADLLLDGWTEVLAEVEDVFRTAGDRASKVAAFLARFAAYLDAHPELLRLDALGHGVIERNLEPVVLAAFKRRLNERLASAGAAIDRSLDLSPDRGLQVLMRTYALTRGLWLSYGEGVAPAGTRADFARELADALAEYWRGALAAT